MNKRILTEIITESAEETFAAGRAVGECLAPGDVVALTGELGAGKTCFTAGLARGLGVGEDYVITSPTFTLVNEYPARYTLYHLDVYRLNDETQLPELGYEEFIANGGVVVIEWADKIASALPDTAISIQIEYVAENQRKLKMTGFENRIKEFASAMKTEVD
ncbi:MAG: tRNA (adenosine(37)-N6)-threonylcarbamoyltransferase complex ATPase subunit type 1 TsaE [Smithellaceae bacterium]